MDPYEKVAIGETGVEVTRLGLGGAPLSGMVLADGLYRGCGYGEALELVDHAWKMGVRYFDTAPLYGEGRSEVRYGRVLATKPRESFVLSTKVGRLLLPEEPDNLEPDGEDGIPRFRCEFGYTAAGVRASLASSLERLRLREIDILYVHDSDGSGRHGDDDFAIALEEAVRLRDAGVVRAIGMGMNEWELTGRMMERFDIDFVLLAGRYTLLEQSALSEFLPQCIERGVQLAIGGPFNSGILVRDLDQPVSYEYQPAPENLVHKARQLRAVCDRHNVPLPAAALQFPFGHEAVATTVPGAASVEELEENARLMQIEIPPALWEEMKAEGLLPAAAPTPTP
jgi:D-threo-aldose 1-dehydrogenase